MSDTFRRVMYLSKSRHSFTQDELLGMCAAFAANNALKDVTGVLMHVGNWFVQIIEGPPDAIECLYAKIEADPRHGCVTLLSDHRDDQRTFGQWSMHLANLDSVYYLNLPAVVELREQVEDMLEGSTDRKPVIRRLITDIIGRIRAAAPRGAARC